MKVMENIEDYNCVCCNNPYYRHENMYHCDKCRDIVCKECFFLRKHDLKHDRKLKVIDRIYANIPNNHKNPISIEGICLSCLRKAEIKMISEIPQKDLPLHINDEWETDQGTLAYKERLATAKETLA